MISEVNPSFFENESLPSLQMLLKKLNEDQLLLLGALKFKDPKIALILSILLGPLGVDRFYIGDTWLGVFKLLTFGMSGLWVIADWFLIAKKTRSKNMQKLLQTLQLNNSLSQLK